MKKIKEDGFFMGVMVRILMLFYPIVACIEFFHSGNENADKKKFIYCGFLGVIGLTCFVAAFFAQTFLQKIALVAIASAFYIPGRYKLRNVLIEKLFLGDKLFI